MSNQAKLDQLFFPIVTGDVLTQVNGSNELIKVPGKKVLINAANNKPISVVGSGYEIITNREAFEYGKKCINTLFDMDDSNTPQVHRVEASGNFGFCFIDLIYRNQSLSVLIKDQYIPFVRIINSYNSLFRLSFKVGIYRVQCSNGLMFEDETIKIRFNHVKGAKKLMKIQISKDSFQAILDKFKTNIQIIIDAKIPQDYFFPMFCKALNLNFDLNADDEKKRIRERVKFDEIKSFFTDRFAGYKDELGNENYSLYNVITNAASFGFNSEKNHITRLNKRQSEAGSWLNSFTEMLKIGNVDYNEYLKDYLDLTKN